MGKKPITSAQVRTLRNNVKNKPLQELLLNLGVDLMLRSSDLLNLKVSDVVSDSGKVKSEVRVKQKKTIVKIVASNSSLLNARYLI